MLWWKNTELERKVEKKYSYVIKLMKIMLMTQPTQLAMDFVFAAAREASWASWVHCASPVCVASARGLCTCWLCACLRWGLQIHLLNQTNTDHFPGHWPWNFHVAGAQTCTSTTFRVAGLGPALPASLPPSSTWPSSRPAFLHSRTPELCPCCLFSCGDIFGFVLLFKSKSKSLKREQDKCDLN